MTMRVNLRVRAASSVKAMSNCPKNSEAQCGIMYRAF